MKPRGSIVEKFSTFLKLESDQVAGWIISPKLKRSMETCLRADPYNESENLWALYWHQLWQKQVNQLAAAHLTAHLQESCYWVARKMALGFANRNSIADFFQIAIAQLPKLLKRFDPQHSKNLKSYAELVFKNCLKDWLRIQQKVEVCTDWSLLYRVSRKRLLEVLNSASLSQNTIQQYRFAWECFRELVVVDSRAISGLNCPDDKTWEAIAAAYNANRLSQVSPSAPVSSPEQLEQWLLKCAKSVREFLSPQVISADTRNTEGSVTSWLDSLPDDDQTTPISVLINQEEAIARHAYLVQLSEVLEVALQDLNEESLELLKAYYSQNLTQTKIAQQLGLKQFQVSRQLDRIRRSLLKKITQWSQETLHISPTPEVIDAMSLTLEEWLIQKLKQSGEMEP